MGIEKVKIYSAAVIRVTGLIACALFLPWFFLLYHHAPLSINLSHPQTSFSLGVENITPEFIASIRLGKKNWKAGVITNHTGFDQMGTSTLQHLYACGVPVAKIFSPDSQFQSPKNQRETAHIPVIYLQQTKDIHRILEQHIQSLDAFFFDIQDTGMGNYHAIAILFELIKISALYHKTVIVLDRPNALGAAIEGNGIATYACPDFILPLPLRYGMTIGEVARYFNSTLFHQAASLYVIPMKGYQRTMAQEQPAQSTALATCIDIGHSTNVISFLSEVQPFDIAVSTQYAYQCILLPECLYISKRTWHELKAFLEERKIHTSFYSYFNTKKKQKMMGLRIVEGQAASLASFSTLLHILRFFKERGIKMTFSQTFDQCMGSSNVRDYLQGNLAWEQLELDINKGLHNFYANAQRAFLYKPYPKISML